MLIIDRGEKLWQACIEISNNPRVVESELFGCGKSDDHFVLGYGPVAQRNQFQRLLYSASDTFNVSILPINNFDLFGEMPWPGRMVCHFHWLHDKTKNAQTEEDANKAVSYWEKLLHRIKEDGRKIVWTVHNIIPHETVWMEQDKQIHQMMAHAADALHVMTNDSAKLAGQYYTLDEKKIFLVPHPTYEGAQPNEISRKEARKQLHLADDEFVFLSFGAIMQYKGYDRLMAAYDSMRAKTHKKNRLIIAGLPSDSDLVEKIMAWGKGRDEVILDMTPVPHEKIQVYFRSADVAVCPYYRTMNSGAAMMAITFDIPVLGPNSGAFLDIQRNGFGVTFDNNVDTSLVDMMLHLVCDDKMLSQFTFKAKQDFCPRVISNLFFSNIKCLFG